jgi:predicted transport protein
MFGMAKSPEEMAAAMIANFPEKTGKPLDAWIKIVAASDVEKHGEIVKFLKTEHGMTHGFANLVAHKAREVPGRIAGGDDLVTAQYAGPKADLKPIYDAIIKALSSFGKDVEVSPKKAYVSLRRSKQFALVQPSTKTRVDLGLNLKDVTPEGRLEASGSFNAMVSHRVRLEKVADVDKDVKAWLKAAYERA